MLHGPSRILKAADQGLAEIQLADALAAKRRRVRHGAAIRGKLQLLSGGLNVAQFVPKQAGYTGT